MSRRTQQDIGDDVRTAAKRIVPLAHQEDRWLTGLERVPNDQRHRERVPDGASSMFFHYAVHRKPAPTDRDIHKTEPIRHLSMQFSVWDDGNLTQEVVNQRRGDIIADLEPVILEWFPLAGTTGLSVGIDVLPSVPVKDPTMDTVLKLRVPIVVHVTCPLHAGVMGAAPETASQVVILGPNGKPARA